MTNLTANTVEFKVGDKARQLELSKYGNGKVDGIVVIEQTNFVCSDGTHPIAARPVEGGTGMLFRPSDLEKYEAPEDRIEQLERLLSMTQDELLDLSLRVRALEDKFEPAQSVELFPEPAEEPARVATDQDIRDMAIEQAKQDVERLMKTPITMGVRNFKGQRESFYPKSHGSTDKVEFVVNREKRTVVALIKYMNENRAWARGVAKCDPTDVFNEHIGKAIALRRAFGLEIPSEYIHAPEPTEIRVGDVIERTGNGIFDNPFRTVTEIKKRENGDLFYKTKEGQGHFAGVTDHENVRRIVDDSREAIL
jgi:hypothetical protein